MDASQVAQSLDISDVVKRFFRYVQVDSPSNPDREETTPSNEEELAMAALLGKELEELGAKDVKVDGHGYVTAKLDGSPEAAQAPRLGLIAHIDSTSDAPAHGVKPQIVAYEGGDLVMGEVDGRRVRVTADSVPDLAQMAGQPIVTSDGTTLLSADDKAGVAEIMALLARYQKDPRLPHPPLAVAFVPDEEIGHGAALLNLEDFGAAYAFTVDGEQLGEINYECFSAADALVTIEGVMVHPGAAKDRMVNAISLWRDLDSMLPAAERPEHTEGREGYFHCHSIEGTPAQVKAHYLIRDFDAAGFERRLKLLQDAASMINEREGKARVQVAVKPQYRNMAEHFKGSEFLIDAALMANRQQGVEPRCVPVRGGTDGAQLTFRGLLCPNIATGGYLAHSVREFIPVRSLEVTVDILQSLCALLAERPAAS